MTFCFLLSITSSRTPSFPFDVQWFCFWNYSVMETVCLDLWDHFPQPHTHSSVYDFHHYLLFLSSKGSNALSLSRLWVPSLPTHRSLPYPLAHSSLHLPASSMHFLFSSEPWFSPVPQLSCFSPSFHGLNSLYEHQGPIALNHHSSGASKLSTFNSLKILIGLSWDPGVWVWAPQAQAKSELG